VPVAPVQQLQVEPGAPVELVQVTDTHLGFRPGGTLLGMDTDSALQTVLARVRRDHPGAHALLATGDLADNGSPAAYERLGSYLDAVTARHFWLPGNHDLRPSMVAVAGEQRLPGELRAGNWQVLLLDSQLPGRVGGELGAAELARLEEALARAAAEQLYTLVCLHHQPVPVGCAWLDEQRVSDADQLFALLERAAGARALLWGHVHQEFDRRRGSLRLLCTPSTCVQFRPGQASFSVDDAAPGFRWLKLHPDGRIDSAVTRVEVGLPVDVDSRGYQ
jgi:Icc protein